MAHGSRKGGTTLHMQKPVEGHEFNASATKNGWIKIYIKLLLVHHSQFRAWPKLLTLSSEKMSGCSINNLRIQEPEAGESYIQGQLGLCSKALSEKLKTRLRL